MSYYDGSTCGNAWLGDSPLALVEEVQVCNTSVPLSI